MAARRPEIAGWQNRRQNLTARDPRNFKAWVGFLGRAFRVERSTSIQSGLKRKILRSRMSFPRQWMRILTGGSET